MINAHKKAKPLPMLFLVVLMLGWSLFVYAGENWQTVGSGLLYQDLGGKLPHPWAHIYAFKIDLSKYQLSLKLASELDKKHASIDRLADDENVVLAINGGFFDKNFHPLGLRISDGIRKNRLKKISWWGVFYINRGQPYIASPYQFLPRTTNFAVQSGPRLIINHRIPTLKKGLAERSAIGISDDNHIIVLVTDNYRMTTTQLAKIMKSSPLNCRNALNLDGGSSSQLTAKIKDFHLSVHGFSNISDAILVKQKKI